MRPARNACSSDGVWSLWLYAAGECLHRRTSTRCCQPPLAWHVYVRPLSAAMLPLIVTAYPIQPLIMQSSCQVAAKNDFTPAFQCHIEAFYALNINPSVGKLLVLQSHGFVDINCGSQMKGRKSVLWFRGELILYISKKIQNEKELCLFLLLRSESVWSGVSGWGFLALLTTEVLPVKHDWLTGTHANLACTYTHSCTHQ